MAVTVHITWDGDTPAAFARKLLVADKRLENFNPLLKNIRDTIVRPGIRKNFDVGGRPKWKPLSSATLKRKRGSNTSRILIHSGALKRAASAQRTFPVKRNEMVADLDRIPYWRYHQFGEGVPKRVILKMTNDEQAAAGRMLSLHVAEVLETTLRGASSKIRIIR